MRTRLIIGIIALLMFASNAFTEESKLDRYKRLFKDKGNNIEAYSEEEVSTIIVPALLEAAREHTRSDKLKKEYKMLHNLSTKYDLYMEKDSYLNTVKVIYFLSHDLKFNRGQINKNLKESMGIEPIALIEDFDGDGEAEILFDIQRFESRSGIFSIYDKVGGKVIWPRWDEESICGIGEYSFDAERKTIILTYVGVKAYRSIEGTLETTVYEVWTKGNCMTEFKYADGKIIKVSGPTDIDEIVERKLIWPKPINNSTAQP